MKIDRSFVTRLGDARSTELVRSIVMLSRNMGFHAMAEGIETIVQARLLDEMGCGLGQGYLFARPLPAATTYSRCHHNPT